MILTTHPLMQKRGEEPGPSMIPIPQALAMELEIAEDLEAQLATTRQNIQHLRDC